MFVPLAREGWLQKLVASPGHPFGQWRVLWVELLEDGKLSWFDSSRKRKSDFRCNFVLFNFRCAEGFKERGFACQRKMALGHALEAKISPLKGFWRFFDPQF